MSSADRRRELVQAYKERPRQRGVFAVRCTASGEVWIEATHNLETARNPIWFSLRQGSHRNAQVQAALKAHGIEAFAYEVVEQIDDTALTPLGVNDLLKARAAHWREALGAGWLNG